MLILPKSVIQTKLDNVRVAVENDIISVFILPFAIFSLIMMFVISYFLNRISTEITKPIIELYQKI